MLSEDESSSSSSSGSDIHQLTINEHYAKAFQAKKEREELQKLKDKYGSDAELDEEEEDSEDDESEDEDGEQLTPAMDVAIIRTLAKIKNRDPSIYDAKKNVFEEEQQTISSVKQKSKSREEKTKALTIKQHALNSVLNPATSRSPSPAPFTYAREQEELKKETVAVFKNAVAASDDEDDEDDFLVPREKTKDEIVREEEEYREFLQREIGPNVDIRELITVEDDTERIHEEGEGETSMPSKKKKKKKEKAVRPEQSDQDFLVNYILNRGWIDKNAKRLPTYEEITGTKKKAENEKSASQANEQEAAATDQVQETVDADDIDVEDDFDDLTERFESSYNFRFEEPGAATIATHPRNLPSLVRRQDTSRKEAREKRKQRKEEEKALKREEVKRLKALKMREIRGKIEKIEQEAGKGLKSDALKSLEEDLDDDWDPTEHDAKMKRLYDEDTFYAVEDDDKPHWADDIDITDIVGPEDKSEQEPKKKRKRKKDKDANEDGFAAVDEGDMDANVEHDWEWERAQWDGSEESRKRLVQKYMDEVYALEFNDMVGDLPTRFKYVNVPASSYALDPVEILLASDKELNEYMSIKRLAPYKNKQHWDKDRNTKLKELKQKLASRTWDGVPASEWSSSGRQNRVEGGEHKKKKRMGKKERKKLKAATAVAEADASGHTEDYGPSKDVQATEEEPPRKKRKIKA